MQDNRFYSPFFSPQFGTLKRYAEAGYYEAHPVLYLLMPGKSYKVELLAGLYVSLKAPVYGFPFDGDTAYLLEWAQGNSVFSSDVVTTPGDRLLTLSTCSGSNADRLVLIGVLRELEG